MAGEPGTGTGTGPGDFQVDEDIRKAETLPAGAFIDPGFLERELATVFSRAWLLVPDRGAGALTGEDARPLAEALAVRGARVPISVAGKPLFLQRGWDDDRLRCFPNVCTHAWYPLVTGPSRGSSLTCGQHGRKFDCGGRFLSQPGFDGAGAKGAAFPRECDHLRALPVEAWGPFLFVCLGTEPPLAPLADVLRPVSESVAAIPQDGMRPVANPAGEVREVGGNWKQHAWNYMDSFHVTYIHRAPGGLADAIDLASYRTELHRHAALQWVYARDPAHGFDPALVPARMRHPEKRVFALWWFVFPNLALNFYPWGLSVNVYMPVPDHPDRTLFLWYQRVLDEAKWRDRDRIWLSKQVDEEDVDAMAQVARGIRSGLAPRGRFAPDAETGPHWFHKRVYETVFG